MAVNQGSMASGDEKYFTSENNSNHNTIDEESNSRWNGGNKKIGGRIAPVLPHLIGVDLEGSDSSSDLLGQQIKQEEGNAIQYRTCSWYKVSIRGYCAW